MSRALRVPEMEKRVSFTTSGDWTDLPTDFRAMRALYQDDVRLMPSFANVHVAMG